MNHPMSQEWVARLYTLLLFCSQFEEFRQSPQSACAEGIYVGLYLYKHYPERAEELLEQLSLGLEQRGREAMAKGLEAWVQDNLKIVVREEPQHGVN